MRRHPFKITDKGIIIKPREVITVTQRRGE